jgi:hypothetical protein
MHVGLFKMQPKEQPGRWGLTLHLLPGTYRYRYYADDGRITTYVSPRDADNTAAPMEGLDAILSVSDRPDNAF